MVDMLYRFSALHILALFPETRIMYFVILRKATLKFNPPMYVLNYIQRSGIAFNVSYIGNSLETCIVPMKRA